MSRTAHHRQHLHTGVDLDSNITLNGAITPWATGTDLHTVLTDLMAAIIVDNITWQLEGGTTTLPIGVRGYIECPFAGTLTGVKLFTDQVGSIVIDIWKDTYANFPPTVADSICGSTKPTITNGRKYSDTTLTGWTKSVEAGDVFAFNIDSVTNVVRATVSLTISRA